MINQAQFLPGDTNKFHPTPADQKTYGIFRMRETAILDKPSDVPHDHIAYNPSAVWSLYEKGGSKKDLMYVRVEPNRSDAHSSHLGNSVVRPYIFDIKNSTHPLEAYEHAMEFNGEDPALTKVYRRLGTGALELIWLLSFVEVIPEEQRKNEVKSLRTQFYAGTRLDNLEHVAHGPEWMKDIRVIQGDGSKGTELEVFGRPQNRILGDNGNISHVSMSSIDQLNDVAIENAKIIDSDLLPVGSGVWGGVNDVVKAGDNKYHLLAHRAWRTNNGTGRHYEAISYGFDSVTKRIIDLGVFATATDFQNTSVKEMEGVDVSDVVFTGGGYNGKLDSVTFGVGDASIGIGHMRYN